MKTVGQMTTQNLLFKESNSLVLWNLMHLSMFIPTDMLTFKSLLLFLNLQM